MTQDDLSLIRASALFDAAWYRARYRDVAQAADPARHFLDLGGPLGRDPGPGFASGFYAQSNPDVAAAGLVPFLHYLRAGQAEGRAPHPGALPRAAPAPLARLTHLRWLLESGGLEAGPQAGLEALAECKAAAGPHADAAAGAAEALALWALHRGDAAGAQRWFDRRLEIGAGLSVHRRLDPLRLIAACAAGDRAGDGAGARHLRAAAPPSPDLALARTHLDPAPAARVAALAAALRASGAAVDVTLAPAGPTLFDRLTAPPSTTKPEARTGPMVSVLVAAHNAAATLPAALASLCAQSWQALEILVIDDASTDDTAAQVTAHPDPRIRLIRLNKNAGAYAARNAGLAQARGAYVTLMDADDWAHPERIARQVRHLTAHPHLAGCLSSQARLDPDLAVTRWTGTGALVHEALASLMMPRALMREALGGWDARVRVSADAEALRRLHRLFGDRAVAVLPALLTLQRDHTASATADPATGMGWFYYGARLDYFQAQCAHHRQAPAVRYAEGAAPFAAPALLTRATPAPPDRVYAGILSTQTRDIETVWDWIETDLAAGRRVGLVPLYDISQPMGAYALHPWFRARLDGTQLRVLTYGETLRTARIRLVPGQGPFEPHRYLPQVTSPGGGRLTPGAAPQAG